jgi:uncharacterized RDD family membrane protein YckC
VGRLKKTRGLYFAMELVNGESLDDLLVRGEVLPPERARKLMIQAARGLRDAQRAGIVHRDVKPSNMLVETIEGEERLKIVDFGIAGPQGASAMQSGLVVGTPLYIAPEQALGDGVDFRADMYALGASFFHLLAGVAPFDGATVVQVMVAHVHGRRPRLTAVAPHVPKNLATVIERSLAREPGDRFASYDELIDALEACAPVTLEPAGVWPRGAAVALNLLASLVITVPLGAWGLLFHLVYITVAHAHRGQTIGKHVMRIRVVRSNGERLGLARAAARTLAVLWYPIFCAVVVLFGSGPAALAHAVAATQTTEVDKLRELTVTAAMSHPILFVLYALSFVFAALHPRKLALHDLLLGTRVVYALR